MIADIEDGLWVKNTIGFGVDSVTGSYSVGASGRWIRQGKLAEPVSGITIASSLDHLLHSIDAVGNDLEWVQPHVRDDLATILDHIRRGT